MESYPKIKYHLHGGGSITVTSAVQEKALGEEWLDRKPFTPIQTSPAPQKKHVRNDAKGA